MSEQEFKNKKRRHHIVPRFVLKHFSHKVLDKDFVWVHPISEERPTPVRLPIQSVAVRKDFYSLELSGKENDLFEDMLAKVEGLVAPIWANVCESKNFPSDSELSELLYFFALLYCRNPAYRRMGDEIATGLLNLQRKLQAKDLNFLEAKAKEFEKIHGEKLSPEELKKALVESRTRLVQTQAGYLGQIAERTKEIYIELRKKKWILGITDGSEGDFVLSDNPVGLTQVKQIPFPFGVGFGVPGVQVSVPLSSTLSIFSSEDLDEREVVLNRRGISLVNSATILESTEVYSATSRFEWYWPKQKRIQSNETFDVDRKIFRDTKRSLKFS